MHKLNYTFLSIRQINMLKLSTILCITILLGMHPTKSLAQNTQRLNEEEIYASYLEQIGAVFASRGMQENEIASIIQQFKNSNITNDQSFADVLNALYPNDRNIGILFYFFKDDHLRILFAEPGNIIEKKVIDITEAELLALNNNINQSLSLYQQTANRSPKLRSTVKKDSSQKSASAKISFEKSIEQASSVLLPEKLNRSFKHLVIIPALNIGSVPFYLLKMYGEKKFLVDYCSYSIAPSIVDLIALRYKMLKAKLPTSKFNFINGLINKGNVKENIAEKNLILHSLDSTNMKLNNALLVGNPAYPTNTDYVFPDLQGAKKEIYNAAKFATRYTLFEGTNAVKDSIMQYLPKADVAYFATHGIANNENPMEQSFLVLSGNSPFLTAREIMNTRKTLKGFPKMVILSACQTGLGKYMNAGTVGLARSFLIAGSNHVIMSLWNVDDNATAFLMNRFIEHLQNKQSNTPSGALRLAVLDTKQKFTSPDKWACFSVFGVDY